MARDSCRMATPRCPIRPTIKMLLSPADRGTLLPDAVRAWNHAVRRPASPMRCAAARHQHRLRLARRHVATHHVRTQATANLLHADQLHARGFTIASEASSAQTVPRVSIIPNASIVFPLIKGPERDRSFNQCVSCVRGFPTSVWRGTAATNASSTSRTLQPGEVVKAASPRN